MTTAALRSIARIFNGNSISQAEKNKHFRGAEGLPYIGTAEVGFDAVINYDSGVAIPPQHQSDFKLAKAGTALVCAEGGSAGRKVGFLTKDAFFGNKLFAIEPSKNWDGKFLFYFCLSADFRSQFNDMTTGLIGGVSIKKFKEIRVPAIPLYEQRRIVAVLDKAFAGIASAAENAQKNLLNARELFEGSLRTVFIVPTDGNERRKVGDLLQLQRGFDITKSQQSHGSFPVVSSGGIKSFHSEAMAKGPGVVIGRKGTLGKVFYVESDYWPHDTTLWVKDFKANYPRLVCYMLRCLDVKSLDTGTANPALNRNLVHELEVFWPKGADQPTLASRLDRISEETQRLAANLNAKLAALTELKQSLLHKAFAGELTAVAQTATAATNDNFSAPQFSAQVLAFAHRRHEQKQTHQTFGHVKAQKVLHLVESIGGIDLGRQPIKDAAGPNDMQHMLRATDWAVQQRFFEFVPRANGKGYDFKKLANFDACWAEAEAATNPVAADLKRAIDLIVDMESSFAELIATTHAAWNNLIIDMAAISDDAIVLAARDNWNESKLKFDASRFHDAIRFIRTNGIEPDGSAKYVGGQERLL